MTYLILTCKDNPGMVYCMIWDSRCSVKEYENEYYIKILKLDNSND